MPEALPAADCALALPGAREARGFGVYDLGFSRVWGLGFRV